MAFCLSVILCIANEYVLPYLFIDVSFEVSIGTNLAFKFDIRVRKPDKYGKSNIDTLPFSIKCSKISCSVVFGVFI